MRRRTITTRMRAAWAISYIAIDGLALTVACALSGVQVTNFHAAMRKHSDLAKRYEEAKRKRSQPEPMRGETRMTRWMRG